MDITERLKHFERHERDAGDAYGAEVLHRAAKEIDDLRIRVKSAESEAKKWRRIRTPTHGPCCTCQGCGLDYDSCRCDLDDVADQLEEARKEITGLHSEINMYLLDFADRLETDIYDGEPISDNVVLIQSAVDSLNDKAASLQEALSEVLKEHTVAELMEWSDIGTLRALEIILMVSSE